MIAPFHQHDQRGPNPKHYHVIYVKNINNVAIFTAKLKAKQVLSTTLHYNCADCMQYERMVASKSANVPREIIKFPINSLSICLTKTRKIIIVV